VTTSRCEQLFVTPSQPVIALVQDWSSADNHKYLLAYWLWVMTLATAVRDEELGELVLVRHARFFLIFVFLVAALQKLFSPTYMSGEVFELKLLLDERFKRLRPPAWLRQEYCGFPQRC
jgi:hypothetical protein